MTEVRRRWSFTALTVGIAGAAVLGAVLWFSWASQPGPRDAAGDPPPSPEPTSAASPAEAQAVHDALHDIGAKCEGTPPAGTADVAADVETVIAFTRRYPEGRFPIDDEMGTPLSLLLVVRQALDDCDPAGAARIDAELPAEFRSDAPKG